MLGGYLGGLGRGGSVDIGLVGQEGGGIWLGLNGRLIFIFCPSCSSFVVVNPE
jgi:hypothetical protein